jgi:hypothetical protein
VKKDEMGGVCNTNGEEECILDNGGKVRKERDHWEDQDLGGWILER